VPGGKGAKGKAAAASVGKGAAAQANAKVQAGSEALGTDALLQLLKNYARNAEIKTAITVGEGQSTHTFAPLRHLPEETHPQRQSSVN
jgi:hypothetical protein